MNFAHNPREKEAPDERLIQLEKRYRRSRKKVAYVLSIPILWGLGALVAFLVDELWIWEALVGWCLLVTFLVGVYVLYQVPSTRDVEHQYSQIVLPKLFLQSGMEKVRVARRHDLALKTFLDAGLYHDKFSSMVREDSIQGHVLGAGFGMYEVAIQIDTAQYGRLPGPDKLEIKATQFYGWFIVVQQKAVPGFHFLTMRKRVHPGESDDWHSKTLSHWENDKKLQRVESGNPTFDEAFCLNSDQPGVLSGLLSEPVRGFLLHLATTTKNSLAISIQRGNIYLLIGHEAPSFRMCPQKNFATEIPLELQEEVIWFVETLRGLARINR